MAIEIIGVSIIDRLIKLLTVRERNKEKYFNNYIQPLYEDAEAVATDYMTLFAELVRNLEGSATLNELIAWLEQRRKSYQPVRMKIRALLTDDALQKLSKNKSKAARLRFARGLWGMLKGTFLLGQDDKEGRYGYLREYGYGDHAILPLLESMRRSNQRGQDNERREHLVWFARKQQAAIEAAWADVVKAYAELKRDVI